MGHAAILLKEKKAEEKAVYYAAKRAKYSSMTSDKQIQLECEKIESEERMLHAKLDWEREKEKLALEWEHEREKHELELMCLRFQMQVTNRDGVALDFGDFNKFNQVDNM